MSRQSKSRAIKLEEQRRRILQNYQMRQQAATANRHRHEKIPQILTSLSPNILQLLSRIAFVKYSIRESVFLQISDINIPMWNMIKWQLRETDLIHTFISEYGFRTILFDNMLLSFIDMLLNKEAAHSLLQKYMTYYYQLSASLVDTYDDPSITSLVKQERIHFQHALQLMGEHAERAQLVDFVGNLEYLWKHSAELSIFITPFRRELGIVETHHDIFKRKKKEEDAHNMPTPSRRLVTKVLWTFLPPGEQPFAHILNYVQNLQKANPHLSYDIGRLETIHTLQPTHIYVGSNEFEGYITFYFQDIQTAVLECPKINNALYILHGDWKSLSKLSKAVLLESHAQNVTRIVHAGDWFSKLKQHLH